MVKLWEGANDVRTFKEVESDQTIDYIEEDAQGRKRVTQTIYKRTKANPEATWQGARYFAGRALSPMGK